MDGVKAITFQRQEIGGMIKASKVQFRWRLSFDGQMTTIEVLSSKLSGKRRVFRDGVLIADKQQFEGAFQFNFHVMHHAMQIMQHGEHFELRIDNVSFSHLHAQEQTKSQFVYEDHKNNTNHTDGSQASSNNPQFPFQTKQTTTQPTTFDFNNPMPAQPNSGNFGGSQGAGGSSNMTSMSGGPSSMVRSAHNPAARSRPNRQTGRTMASSGWDDVAAAKNEVFAKDDEDQVAESSTGLGSRFQPSQNAKPAQSTTFDFNSYGASATTGPPIVEKHAQPSPYGQDQQTFNQHRAGLKFGGFQRQEQGNRPKQSYDSYGGDSYDDKAAKATKTSSTGGASAHASGAGGNGATFFEFNMDSTDGKQAAGVVSGNLLDDAAVPTSQSAPFDFNSAQGTAATQNPPSSGFAFQFDTGAPQQQQTVSSSLLELGSETTPTPSPLDILQGVSVPTPAPAQTQQNLDDLLSQSQQPLATNEGGDTLAALQDLNLGGKTAEEAAIEQQMRDDKAAEELKQAEEKKKEEEEAVPISRKDAALNSLVNFEDLKGEKKVEEEKKKDEAPIYIKPTETSSVSTFVPQASLEVAKVPSSGTAEPKAITFQPSPEVLVTAKQDSDVFAGLGGSSAIKTQPLVDQPIASAVTNAPGAFDFGTAASQPKAEIQQPAVVSQSQPAAAASSSGQSFEFTF